MGVEHAVVERVEYDEDEPVIVVHVRAGRRQRGWVQVCDPASGVQRGPALAGGAFLAGGG